MSFSLFALRWREHASYLHGHGPLAGGRVPISTPAASITSDAGDSVPPRPDGAPVVPVNITLNVGGAR